MDDSEQKPAPDTQPPVDALETQISLLTELNAKVESLRLVRSYLRPPRAPGQDLNDGVLPLTEPPTIQEAFDKLRALTEQVQSDAVQNALKIAKESAIKDTHGLSMGSRRRRVLKRTVSPDSPQPVRSFELKSPSSLPPDDPSIPSLRVAGLVEYIKEHNKSSRHRLQIWTATVRTPDQALPDPLVVRFIIPDVVTFYMALGTVDPDATIVVESATAFGSREKKPPHSQSDYVVFQRLSQHLAKMLQSRPQASFQLVMQLLTSYEDVFVRQCSECQRVISADGHIPPVSRTWIEEKSEWDARHPVCAKSD